MKAFLIAAALALAALPAQAAVTVIDFNTVPVGVFSGQVEEDGYIYSAQSGTLLINGPRRSGQDMEGHAPSGGGVLKIVAANGGLFTFLSMAYGYYDQTLDVVRAMQVYGLRGGQVIGSDEGGLLSTNRPPSSSGLYSPFYANDLFGVAIDELHIVLPAGMDPAPYYFAVDRISLQAVAVPEPGAWALLILGFGMAGATLRRRATAAA